MVDPGYENGPRGALRLVGWEWAGVVPALDLGVEGGLEEAWGAVAVKRVASEAERLLFLRGWWVWNDAVEGDDEGEQRRGRIEKRVGCFGLGR